MNAKKQDYVNAIVNALEEAKNGKKKYIELSSREVARMTNMQPVMSTCCSVMKQMMVEGDKIVRDSRSKNGYDSHLTVKYQVNDREGKKAMFDIRRGKPKGTAGRRKEKAAAEKKDLALIASEWLNELGSTRRSMRRNCWCTGKTAYGRSSWISQAGASASRSRTSCLNC